MGKWNWTHTWENVFHLVLVSFSVIVHRLISEINCIMYQDYFSRSFEPFPSSVCNISWPSHCLHTVRFSRCEPCWYCLPFLRMCHEKERRRQQYLLTRPQKIINFCDKTVIFHFKNSVISWKFILSSMQQKYSEPWEKSHFMNFAQNEL